MAVFTKGSHNCACSRERCDFTCQTYIAYISKTQNNLGTWQENIIKEYKTKQTNADRIRARSDEELAIHFSATTCPSKEARKKCVTYGQYEEDGCVQCWRDWLKQEAAE